MENLKEIGRFRFTTPAKQMTGLVFSTFFLLFSLAISVIFMPWLPANTILGILFFEVLVLPLLLFRATQKWMAVDIRIKGHQEKMVFEPMGKSPFYSPVPFEIALNSISSWGLKGDRQLVLEWGKPVQKATLKLIKEVDKTGIEKLGAYLNQHSPESKSLT